MSEEERDEFLARRGDRGRKKSEVTKQKLREAWTPERRAKHSELMRELNATRTAEIEAARREGSALAQRHEQVRQAKSRRMKELWADPEYRKRTIAAMHSASRAKRGRQEQE